MANTPYENIVLENALNDVLDTKLNATTLMDVDDSLATQDGMIKRINRYTYTGSVEAVAEGSGNTTKSSIAKTSYDYEVLTYQQNFEYTDEEALQDSKIVDFGVSAGASEMVNNVNALFLAELQKTEVEQSYSTIGYDSFVDAIGKLALEDETNLYIVCALDMRDAIRKDSDFVAAKQGEMIFSGHIGFISGIPVIVSKLIPSGEAYIADKAAVKFFRKKSGEVEQARDIDTRKNNVVMRLVGLVALIYGTKVCRLAKAATTATTITTYTKAAKTVAGAATTGATVKVYINGVLDGTCVAANSAYSYTAKANLVAADEIVVVARKSGEVSSSATATVAA